MSRAQLTSTVEQNTGGAVSPYVAGKNAVINGGMDIWQRGTSFSVGNGWIYTADRWQSTEGAGTWTLSRESSVVPLGSQYSLKLTSGGTTSGQIATLIETANVTQFQGKTITISAQVAASTSIPMAISLYYSTTADDNITNTSTAISATTGGTATPTSTTFVTLTGTYAIPSTAKTLQVRINSTGNMTSTQAFYVGQVQLEIGSVATSFSRAGGTLSGELAACQRYYQRWNVSSTYGFPAPNYTPASTTSIVYLNFAPVVNLRIGTGTTLEYGGSISISDSQSRYSGGTWSNGTSSTQTITITYTHGSAALTQYRPYTIQANNDATVYFAISAEL